jgi:hypothetical protein
LETEKTRTGTSSKLLVIRATEADSGSYTCDPSRGQSKTADVHIITGNDFFCDIYNFVQQLIFFVLPPKDEQPAELQDGLTSFGTRQQETTNRILLFIGTFSCMTLATFPAALRPW